MSLAKLQEAFVHFGKQFEMLWINPGSMRWISKEMPTKYFSSIDLFKAGRNKHLQGKAFKKTNKRTAKAKAKLCVVGALTLPVGLPVALVALPIMFFYKGIPFMRTQHLDKVTEQVKKDFKMHKDCARQCAKVLTGIGHPKLEKICESCQAIIEGWAQEAAELVKDGKVPVDEDTVQRIIEDREDNEDEDDHRNND